MHQLYHQILIQVNPRIYLKDPNSSELGKRIIQEGINLIDEIGLEQFTFRKLAVPLATTESSIYRYFENKHKLLLYLTSWYWGWLEYHLIFATNNVSPASEKLRIAIDTMVNGTLNSSASAPLDLTTLHRIVISESSKAYLTKEVDEDNKVGFHVGYKQLVGRLSQIISENNKNFKFSKTLASTIIEGIHHQQYFAEHLPSLTEINSNRQDLSTFYSNLALSAIK